MKVRHHLLQYSENNKILVITDICVSSESFQREVMRIIYCEMSLQRCPYLWRIERSTQMLCKDGAEHALIQVRLDDLRFN